MGAIREDKKVPFDWKKQKAFKNLLTTMPIACKGGNDNLIDFTFNQFTLLVFASEGEMLSQLKSFSFCQLKM